jgi:chitodextrinase
VKNPALYLTAGTSGGPLTLRAATSDGTQDWSLDQLAPVAEDLTPALRDQALVESAQVTPGQVVTLDATASDPAGNPLHRDVTGHAYLVDGQGAVRDLGPVPFAADQRGQVTVPADVAPGADLRIAVQFDDTRLVWDDVEVSAAAPAWDPATVYVAGDTVTHGGATWLASWWTAAQVPGDPNGPWQEIATAADGQTVWTASRVFHAGDTALHGETVYRASWWTRNQVPGDPNGPWRVATTG